MTAVYSYQEVRQKLRKLWGEQKHETKQKGTDKRLNVRLMSKEET